jgi:hypothetical protein
MEFNDKERQREREMQGSDPIADGAVGAAFGRGAAGAGAAGLTASSAGKGAMPSNSSSTTGLGDLAPPIPATQTGVLDNKGTHLIPETAPAGIPTQSNIIEPKSTSTAAPTYAAPVSANASGRSTPVPRAGALGAGTSDAVLTPSEAAVAQQASSYMDAHPETGASEKDDKAAQAVLAATAGAGAAGLGAGAYLANKDTEGVKSGSSAPPNERLDSMASVTAIRHGQPGDLHNGADKGATTGSGMPAASSAGGLGAAGTSPLATVTSSGANDTTTGAGAGQKSTTRGTGPNHTTSLTPGGEEGSIGHPPTVAQGGEAVRQTGTYPKAQHEDAVGAAIKEAREHGSGMGGNTTSAPASGTDKEGGVKDKIAEMTSASNPSSPRKDKDVGAASAAGVGAGAGTPNKAGANGAVPPSPVSKSSAAGDGNGHASTSGSSGHRRASSSASTDSKKVGFMKKLKGEMKVISGKLGNNEEKVQLGEKIKHGGE